MEDLKTFSDPVDKMSQSSSQKGSQNSTSSLGSTISSGTLNESLFSQAAMSQRIVTVEYYMSPPVKEFDNLYSEFRNSSVKKVPIIRIFGTTSAGQKICANIHGVYPYISVLDDEAVEGFEYRIASALDNAINDTVNTNKFRKGAQSHKTAATQHVFKVIRVVGKTFYGYRSRSEVFLRIFFYNPLMLKKAVDLLQSGSVLGRRFQPYEAHIPYSLQFMIDYSLYGMNYVHYSTVKFRRKGPNSGLTVVDDMKSLSQNSNNSLSSLIGYVDPESIQESQLGPPQLSKLTLCELEIDVLASDIILTSKVSGKAMSVNPGIDCIWKDEIERRRLHGVENCSQVTIPESQERPTNLPMHSAELKHVQTLWNKLDTLVGHDDLSKESASQPFLNNSYMEEDEVVPSSQVMNHLSQDGQQNSCGVFQNQLSQEQDEFLKLLEEMAKGDPSSEVDEESNEVVEDPFGNQLAENQIMGEFPDDDDGVDEDENLWEESLLDASIVETLLDSDNNCEQSEQPQQTAKSDVPSQTKPIFQCDGQGNDSDCSSDDNKSTKIRRSTRELTPGPNRKSRRMSELKAAETPANSKSVKDHNSLKRSSRHSTNVLDSPGSRLSLTLRRKSRSQDALKSKSQGSPVSSKLTPEPSKSKMKPVKLRRSISMDESVQSGIKNEMPPKKNTDDGLQKLTRSKIRKSSSNNSTMNSDEKAGCSSSKMNTLPKKHKMEIVNPSAAASSKAKIMHKVPLVCLTKLDDEQISSKRVRRKPKRFVEENEDKVPGTQQEKNEVCKEPVIKKPIDGEKLETFPKIKKQKEKQRKASVDEVGTGSSELHHLPINKEVKGEIHQANMVAKPGRVRPSLSTKSVDHGHKISEQNGESEIQIFSRDTKKVIEQQKQTENQNSIIIQKKSKKLKKLKFNKSDTAKTNTEIDLAEDIIKNGDHQVENAKKGDERPQVDDFVDSLISTKPKITPLDSARKVVETKSGLTDKCRSAEMRSQETSLKDPTHVKKAKKKLGMGLSRIKRVASIKITDASASLVSGLGKSIVASSTNGDDEGISIFESSVVVEVKHESPEKRVPDRTSSEIRTTCQPSLIACEVQTDPLPPPPEPPVVTTQDASVTAFPDMRDGESQASNPDTASLGSQAVKEVVSIETQTEAITPLCLCQCTCVIKDKTDVGTDCNQEELKPVMESKRIQVDNVDMIARARSTWFTTPQSNKMKRNTTPSSPEKRRLNDSPSRRGVQNTTPNPSHSRYLNALVLKTPTSTHKYRNFVSRASPSTPTECTIQEKSSNASTPPSREEYLINAIRAASSSPRKRTGHIKPRNLEIETHTGSFSNAAAVSSSTNEASAHSLESPLPLVPVGSIEDEMHGAMESPSSTSSNYDDLSVNSIYEYEEEVEQKSPAVAPSPSWSSSDPDTLEESEEESSPASISSFQRKRIMSKHRTKNRLEKRRAANLDANRGIPDIFDFEFEPLKQPPTYRSTTKWLESGKEADFVMKAKDSSPEKLIVEAKGDSSDEEELPPPVKLFGGGNMSDDDNSDSEETRKCSGSSIDVDNVNAIKPFTPPMVFNCTTPISNHTAQNGESCNSTTTPRSILRQSGISRRQSARVSKRKIRWEDESGSCKRLKMEDDEDFQVKRESADDESQNALSNGTLDKTADISELDGPSFKNALGLENSMSNFQDVKALHQCQFITTMCVEVHCASRNGLLPDPAVDSIYAIFVLISNDYPDGFGKPKEYLQLLMLDETSKETTMNYSYDGLRSTKGYSSEAEMIDAFVTLVRSCDPDIFVGYEIEKSSFGYLIQRALYFGKNLTQELSRVLPIIRKDGEREVPYGAREEWNGTISGRIVLNLWRLLRHEITVNSYTFENAAYHILLRRVCKFSHKTLSMFWSHKMHRHKVVQYYTVRVKGCIQIMEKLDLINRTSELARLFGIQFYEVLSRGSQFRVESMMLRATKPLDYIAPSPNVLQRAKMRAPEYLPLIMEPRSNYYTDPVAVLDFQSLYPSMMIAYNYDYASVLGRVEHLTSLDRFSLGCLDHAVPAVDLLKLKNNIHISPAGIAFVDKSVVKGVVPEMLEQILDTRQMVKRAMKKWKNEGASLRKVLDSRQLGLKLIANVTYGYTSANFSGRMPCVEIADSIVSKGRETLQRAIDYVKENYDRWGAEVVYGDTDSMFVLFRGKSKDEAFKLAYEIAEEVTKANPKPVKLKFEKIYQPCILQSKKRYVGYAYETPDQVKPIYDAKGIETVRRDGCPAVRKILEKTLHVLFTSNKQKKVEEYVKAQFQKLFKGRVSMQDYIFAKEFRGRAGYKPTASVPSLEIAKRLTEHDPRAEPLVKERVPYVVIYGNPTLPLIKLVRTPEEYLENPGTRLNAHYYIEKVIIPALNRCLGLAGINTMKWYLQLPRKYLRNILDQKPKGQGTLDDYILHQNCLRCDGKAEDGLCKTCLSDETSSVIYLQEVVRNAKSKLNACVEICTNCAGETGSCISIDCPVLHKLTRYQRDQPFVKNVERQLTKLDW